MTDGKRCRCRGHGSPEIVDPCIRELVDCLNRHGVRTDGSCCGHGVDNGIITIALEYIEPDPHGRPIWHMKLAPKPIILPYNDATGEWSDRYPTGGRNFSEICGKMNEAEDRALSSVREGVGEEC